MNRFEKFFEAQQEAGGFKGLTFKELNDEQSQELYALYLDHLDTEVKSAKEKADKAEGSNEELQTQLNELTSDINKTNAEYSALNLKLAKVTTESIIGNIESGIPVKYRKAVDTVKAFMKDLKESVKAGKTFDLTIDVKDALKAIATKADTLTTSVASSTRGVMDPNITSLAHRRLTAYEAIPSKPRVGVNQGGTYRWVDQDSGTSVRAAAQIAEGAASPESTIAWIERSIKLEKISDHIPYSDEFEYDYANFMQEIINFLDSNVAIEVDDEIINGSGVSPSYSGILASIPAFTPVASGIADANIFDLMCKVSEDITATEGSKYVIDLFFLNSADIVSINYLLKKDADNNYMNLAQMAAMKGFNVIENNSLAANTMIVGDSRYIHVPEDGLIRVKNGIHSGTDQIDGITRVLVETRKNLLIKNLEQSGWREVTSISAALTTLAT